VEFRILGPLMVVDNGRELTLGPAKQRALLTLLLLRRNEAVSSEQLIDLLWAGAPPATARKSLQVYVSRLRKVMGEGRLETRSRAYLLHVEPGELDLDRFEALVEQSRESEPRSKAVALRRALALFRGDLLADVRYEAFAQTEIARLDELRLQTIEERVDADLACGRERAILPELEGLVEAHPLRERLRGQLMLALYRCGRQADALAVYRQGRELLDEQLGLEPGPELKALERQILAQDPVLAAPVSKPLARIRGARRRRLLGLAAGGALVVVAAVAALVVQETRGGGARLVTAAGNSLAAIDPTTGKIVRDFPVGSTPTTVSVGQGAAWVLNADVRTISRVDPHGGAVTTFATGGTPIDLGAGNAGVWVGNSIRQPTTVVPVSTSVSALDPSHEGSVLKTVPLPRGPAYLPAIAVSDHAVWATSQNNNVFRIDPRHDRVVAGFPSLFAISLDIGHQDDVWVLTLDGHVVKIDGSTNRIAFSIKPAATSLSDLAVGAGSVWASDPYDSTLWRIDPTTPPVTRTISVPTGTDQVAFGAGSVWALNSIDGTLVKIDPRKNRVTQTITIGNTPRGVAYGGGLVWVTVEGAFDNRLAAAFHSRASAHVAIRSSACSDVIFGSTQPPQFLIASDWPLHSGPTSPVVAMNEAVEFVLRQHHFRAGRYRIGLQSCDDSTAQSGNWDPVKCAGNAKLFAADPNVLGVIGPYNSGCAQAEIPIANHAQLAIVSPASVSTLTHTPPGAQSQLGRLYPTRKRNFARVLPGNDREAAALAILAKQLGVKRVYVLRGGSEPYGLDITPWFVLAARRLKVTVVGFTVWNPFPKHAAEAAAIADLVTKQVQRSGAQAVYIASLLFDGRIAGLIVKDLRATLGPSFPIIAGDGFLPVSQLYDAAGPAARGIYVANLGLTPEELPSQGRLFLKQFAATQSNGQLDPTTAQSVAYAAAATQALLNAIARSQGTRASVTQALFATHLTNGTIGSISFDQNGDPTPAPFAIYRVRHGGGSSEFGAVQGATFNRTIYVPANLLRAKPLVAGR
jgi:DNA-binding SARP family transcriptional activator/ABC-type branched-subunit amino acid transport system substrate-binding protein/streptogramin lyase